MVGRQRASAKKAATRMSIRAARRRSYAAKRESGGTVVMELVRKVAKEGSDGSGLSVRVEFSMD